MGKPFNNSVQHFCETIYDVKHFWAMKKMHHGRECAKRGDFPFPLTITGKE
jgi:hypothetical protein